MIRHPHPTHQPGTSSTSMRGRVVDGVSGWLLIRVLLLTFVAGFALASLIHLSPRYCDGYGFRPTASGWAGARFETVCVRWSR